MAFVVDINSNPPSINLSNGKTFKIDVYDFSIVVGWPGDEVELVTIDSIKYICNLSTNAKARLAK